MALASMPTEILHHIFRLHGKLDIPGSSGFKGFRSLALTCRSLNKVAVPYLYKNLGLDPCDVYLLLRTFLQRPQLAPMVKRLRIDRSDNAAPDLGVAYLLLKMPGLLPKACTRHLHPNDAETIVALLIELLLVQLPNLKDLTVRMPILSKNRKLFDEKRWKPSAQAWLSRLQPAVKVLRVFDPGMKNNTLDVLREAQHLIRASRAPHLYVEVDYPLKFDHHEIIFPSVEKLDIMCDGMSREELELLIHACPSLRDFDYSGGEPSEMDDLFGEEVTLRGVISVLEPFRDQLRRLSIIQHHSSRDLTLNDTLPNLKHFSTLTDLKIDAFAMSDFQRLEPGFLPGDEAITFLDKLPQRLEKLCIFQADDDYLDDLDVLASRKAQDFPDLKVLTFLYWTGGETEHLDEIEDELRAVDVEMIFDL